MLEIADAALIIGDHALRIDPSMEKWRDWPVYVYDLGTEWEDMTGPELPMVFAVMGLSRTSRIRTGSPKRWRTPRLTAWAALTKSWTTRPRALGLAPAVVRRYLTRNVSYEFGHRERESNERVPALGGRAWAWRTR